jgi:hypothetical protein
MFACQQFAASGFMANNTKNNILRNFDWKVLLSLTALCTSLCALYVSYRQLKISSEEQQAAVFPYLSCSYNTSPNHTAFFLKNDGMGPAFISGVEVRVGDKTYPDFNTPIKEWLLTQPDSLRSKYSKSDLLSGWVIRPGSDYQVFELRDFPEALMADFWKMYTNMRGRIWFYDIYNNCWVFDTDKNRVERSRDCPVEVLAR